MKVPKIRLFLVTLVTLTVSLIANPAYANSNLAVDSHDDLAADSAYTDISLDLLLAIEEWNTPQHPLEQTEQQITVGSGSEAQIEQKIAGRDGAETQISSEDASLTELIDADAIKRTASPSDYMSLVEFISSRHPRLAPETRKFIHSFVGRVGGPTRIEKAPDCQCRMLGRFIEMHGIHPNDLYKGAYLTKEGSDPLHTKNRTSYNYTYKYAGASNHSKASQYVRKTSNYERKYARDDAILSFHVHLLCLNRITGQKCASRYCIPINDKILQCYMPGPCNATLDSDIFYKAHLAVDYHKSGSGKFAVEAAALGGATLSFKPSPYSTYTSTLFDKYLTVAITGEQRASLGTSIIKAIPAVIKAIKEGAAFISGKSGDLSKLVSAINSIVESDLVALIQISGGSGSSKRNSQTLVAGASPTYQLWANTPVWYTLTTQNYLAANLTHRTLLSRRGRGLYANQSIESMYRWAAVAHQYSCPKDVGIPRPTAWWSSVVMDSDWNSQRNKIANFIYVSSGFSLKNIRYHTGESRWSLWFSPLD